MNIQNCILINFIADARTDKPKVICTFSFSKVEGIKSLNNFKSLSRSTSGKVITQVLFLITRYGNRKKQSRLENMAVRSFYGERSIHNIPIFNINNR